MRPTSEAELAEAVASAKGPLEIRGGGTRQGLGHAVSGDLLETGGMTGITLYEPGALTIVARAGTPLSEIDAALAAEGQRLPFEPMDHRGLYGTQGEPTIGGVVACNISGPRRIQAGACRDSLIGVRFVDGSGTAIKNGGRVMKNVTGYDLVKLMCGSHGTLGVLSEVSFKVLPKSQATGVVLLEGLGDEDAIAALSIALGSPFDVTGAAHLTEGLDGAPVTMIRVEGFEKSVSYRTAELQKLLAKFGASEVERGPDKTAAGWAHIRDATAFAGQKSDVWRFSVKPGDGPTLGKALRGLGAGNIFYDWGGGLVWALMGEGADARKAMGDLEGHGTLIRASDATRDELGVFMPEAAALRRISEGLRSKFDPRGILNPGRMG